MHDLSFFGPTEEPLVPRPVFSNVRAKPGGYLLCDMTWQTPGKWVAFFDLCVTLQYPCQQPNCRGYVVQGEIPGKIAFRVCCQCLDTSPQLEPTTDKWRTYTALVVELLRQQLKPGTSLAISKQEEPTHGDYKANDAGSVQESPARQGADAGATGGSGGRGDCHGREPGEGPLLPARKDNRQTSGSAMPELLELLKDAQAVIRDRYPDSHIRKAALDHLDHSAAWIADLERLKGRASNGG